MGFQQPQQRQPETFNPTEFSSSIPACAGCQDLNTFINPADPSHAALFQQQQSFRLPAQQQRPQQAIQPAFLQQPQRQQQFQPQQQQFQPQQQQFQPQQQFQQQLSAEELAHQRLGQSQIQEAVRLQNCLANPRHKRVLNIFIHLNI